QDPSALHLKIRDALKGVGPGQTTPIVELPGGYAILKVLAPRAPASAMGGYRDPRLPLAGPGNVQFVVAVSGFNEVGLLVNRVSKPERWNEDLRSICEVKQRAIQSGLDQVQEYVARVHREGITPRNARIAEDAHYNFGELLAYQGKVDQAI